MAVKHTLTGYLPDLLGADVKGAMVRIGTNLPADVALVDTSAEPPATIVPGVARVSLDGTSFAVDLIATDSTDINVTGGTLRYMVHVDYSDGRGGKRTWSSTYFALTADADLSEKSGEEYLPPSVASAAIEQVQGLVDEATAITGIEDAMEAVAYGIETNNPVITTPLNAEIADQVTGLDPAAFDLAVEAAAEGLDILTGSDPRSPQPLATETGYAFALTDQNDRAFLRALLDGRVVSEKLATSESGDLLRDVVPSTVPVESGFLFAITDQADRVLFGIRTNGALFPAGGSTALDGGTP